MRTNSIAPHDGPAQGDREGRSAAPDPNSPGCPFDTGTVTNQPATMLPRLVAMRGVSLHRVDLVEALLQRLRSEDFASADVLRTVCDIGAGRIRISAWRAMCWHVRWALPLLCVLAGLIAAASTVAFQWNKWWPFPAIWGLAWATPVTVAAASFAGAKTVRTVATRASALRCAGVNALNHCPVRAFDQLATLGSDSDPGVRSATLPVLMVALAELTARQERTRLARSHAALRRLLRAGDDDLRCTVANALALSGGPQELAAVARCARRASPATRSSLLCAAESIRGRLERSRDRSSLPRLATPSNEQLLRTHIGGADGGPDDA